jgi:hypothetical protein
MPHLHHVSKEITLQYFMCTATNETCIYGISKVMGYGLHGQHRL